MPPYVRGYGGGVPAAVATFPSREVVYLHSKNDTCPCRHPRDCADACHSHGLEITCADELGGRFRLQRGRWYYAALQAHYNRTVGWAHNNRSLPPGLQSRLDPAHGRGPPDGMDSGRPPMPLRTPAGSTEPVGEAVHRMVEVADVGHDHAQLWQSGAGLRVLFHRLEVEAR